MTRAQLYDARAVTSSCTVETRVSKANSTTVVSVQNPGPSLLARFPYSRRIPIRYLARPRAVPAVM